LHTPSTYSHSLHDALPIFPVPADLVHPHGDEDVCRMTTTEPVPGVSTDLDEEASGHGATNLRSFSVPEGVDDPEPVTGRMSGAADRKSTRLNSSHVKISYA